MAVKSSPAARRLHLQVRLRRWMGRWLQAALGDTSPLPCCSRRERCGVDASVCVACGVVGCGGAWLELGELCAVRGCDARRLLCVDDIRGPCPSHASAPPHSSTALHCTIAPTLHSTPASPHRTRPLAAHRRHWLPLTCSPLTCPYEMLNGALCAVRRRALLSSPSVLLTSTVDGAADGAAVALTISRPFSSQPRRRHASAREGEWSSRGLHHVDLWQQRRPPIGSRSRTQRRGADDEDAQRRSGDEGMEEEGKWQARPSPERSVPRPPRAWSRGSDREDRLRSASVTPTSSSFSSSSYPSLPALHHAAEGEFVYGLHPVLAALQAGRRGIHRVFRQQPNSRRSPTATPHTATHSTTPHSVAQHLVPVDSLSPLLPDGAACTA